MELSFHSGEAEVRGEEGTGPRSHTGHSPGLAVLTLTDGIYHGKASPRSGMLLGCPPRLAGSACVLGTERHLLWALSSWRAGRAPRPAGPVEGGHHCPPLGPPGPEVSLGRARLRRVLGAQPQPPPRPGISSSSLEREQHNPNPDQSRELSCLSFLPVGSAPLKPTSWSGMRECLCSGATTTKYPNRGLGAVAVEMLTVLEA